MLVKCFFVVLLFANSSLQRKSESYFPEIVDRESTFKVNLNDTVCLPCRIRKQFTGDRKCLFYWTKDGSVVLQWPRYRMKPNKCLRIRNIRSSDHARFVCHAKSIVGVAQAVRNLVVINRDINATYQPEPEPSTKFVPSVPVPIFFRDTLERTNAKLVQKFFYFGRRAKLKCAITGSPAPIIKWYHNGVLMTSSNSVKIHPRSYALIINPFKSHHIGNYTCVGSNGRGILNMSFIVANKSGDPHPTSPVEEEKLVKEGDNVTLSCKKSANKVKFLVWHPPKRELQKQQNKAKPRDYVPFDYSSKLKNPLKDDSLIVKDFFLYNISQKMHEGTYRCLALYKRSRSNKLVPIKIINLKIKTDSQLAVVQTGSPDDQILLVKIAVPVMGSLLTLVVVVICFRCSRKSNVNNPTKTKPDEEENTLSMHILPNTPTGTLRIHKSLQEFNIANEIKINDETQNDINTSTTVEDEKTVAKTSTQCTKTNSYKQQSKPTTKDSFNSITDSNFSKTRSSSIDSIEPPPPAPPPPPTQCEKETMTNKLLSKNVVNDIETNKKHRHNNNNKRHHKRVKHNDALISSNCENKTPLYNTSHNSNNSNVVDDTKLTESEIPESEEDDQLLQREMKNWEPLIRDSTSYSSDRVATCDDDQLRYDRTVSSETKSLLSSQPQHGNSILSDGSNQHIVI